MKYRDCFYAWTPAGERKPTAGQVKVGPHPDRTRWSAPYTMSDGACESARKNATGADLLVFMLVDFHTMVVRDGIDPQVAHAAFLAIDEYREVISPDIEGADHDG